MLQDNILILPTPARAVAQANITILNWHRFPTTHENPHWTAASHWSFIHITHGPLFFNLGAFISLAFFCVSPCASSDFFSRLLFSFFASAFCFFSASIFARCSDALRTSSSLTLLKAASIVFRCWEIFPMDPRFLTLINHDCPAYVINHDCPEYIIIMTVLYVWTSLLPSICIHYDWPACMAHHDCPEFIIIMTVLYVWSIITALHIWSIMTNLSISSSWLSSMHDPSLLPCICDPS